MLKGIFVTLLLAVLTLTGCTDENPGKVLNPSGTPIDVNVVSNVGTNNNVTVKNTTANPVPVYLDSQDYNANLPYFVGIAEGEVPGHTPFYLIGYNPTVGSTDEDIWQGSSVYVFPTAAQRMRIFSSSIADNITGTGIRTVRIYYLDGAYVEHTEDISLTGTAFKLTTAVNIFRVNGLVALTSGTNYKAAGTITLEGLTGIDYRIIAPGYTRDRCSITTIPAGKTLYITQLYIGVGGLNASNMCRTTLRANFIVGYGLLPPGMFQPHSEKVMPNGDLLPYFNIPLVFPSTADVKFSAYTDAGSAFVEVDIRGWIE